MYNDLYVNEFLNYLYNIFMYIPYRLIVQTIKIKFLLLKNMLYLKVKTLHPGIHSEACETQRGINHYCKSYIILSQENLGEFQLRPTVTDTGFTDNIALLSDLIIQAQELLRCLEDSTF